MEAPTPFNTGYNEQQEQIDKAALVHCISEGCSRPAACRRVGVSLATFQHWLETDLGFAEKVAGARSIIIGEMEALACQCARKAEDDPRYLPALFSWLTNRAGWAEAQPAPEHTKPTRSSTPRRRR